MMRVFEIGVWCLTALQVLAVVTIIVLETVFGFHLSPSSVSVQSADALFVLANSAHWQAVAAPTNVRGKRAPRFGPGLVAKQAKANARRKAQAGASKRSASGKRGPGSAPGRGPRGQTPDSTQIAGGGPAGPTWQQNDQGLPELPTVYLPYQVIERYTHADEAKDALTSVASKDIPYGGGTAVQLGTVPPDHPLAKYIGLQAGDIVIAVNGYAVSRQNGMDIYNRLKNKQKFRVEIERRGSRFVAKYERQ